MHCIEPALKIQRQHLLQERRARNIGIELCKDQPFFKPDRNEQITKAQPGTSDLENKFRYSTVSPPS